MSASEPATHRGTPPSPAAWRYRFTVFTATYDSADTLHRVYESLQQQTCRDFEWLVVDDGSTDNTAELVRQWQSQADFPIRYYFQPNSGKHAAYNRAVPLAEGELLVTADADDSFAPHALERIWFHWQSIPAEKRQQFSGICCPVQNQHGELVGRKFPFSSRDSNLHEIIYRDRYWQEQWPVYRTDVLRQFPFPEVPGEKYVPEGVVWFKIARHYRMRYINEPLRTYFQRGTGDRPAFHPPKSDTLTTIYHLRVLNEDIGWFRYAPLLIWRSAAIYAHFSFLIGRSWRAQWKEVRGGRSKALWLSGVLPGYAAYLRDRWRMHP